MSAIGDLTFRMNYWDDPRAKERFKAFLVEIHGLDLSLWEQKGYWDDENYTAFSLFDGARMVATTNLFSMEMVVSGSRRRLGQFSGVGTLPEYRRRGLNRWLTEKALEWAGPHHDGFFLFADNDAIPFYSHCGFEPVSETVATLAVEASRVKPGLLKLDPENDRDLERIYRLACEREPVSDLLGAWNAKLLMFHCLYTLRDFLYYLPELDLALFFHSAGGRLTLFDVVGRKIPPFRELHPYLSVEPHREIRFRFMPDKLGVVPTSKTALEESNAQIYPPLRLPEPERLFPYACHA